MNVRGTAPAPHRRRGVLPALACAAALAAPATHAQEDFERDALGYVGGGIGQGWHDVGEYTPDDERTAWKLFSGARAANLGAEIGYFQFGSTGWSTSTGSTRARLRGATAHAIAWLPWPGMALEFFAKAGVSVLDGKFISPGQRQSLEDTRFAWGLGAQLRFDRFALRAEGEQFQIGDRTPTLMTVSFSLFLPSY